MKINSENIEIAFFVDIELKDINGYSETLKFIQRERGFISDRMKYLESELMYLQSDIESLDQMKNEIDVDSIGFHDIKTTDDIPNFIDNSSDSIQLQCSNLLTLYNEYLGYDDVEIKRLLLELRPKLKAFATFDTNGFGTMKTLINFEEYISINLFEALSNLFDYVERVNNKTVLLIV